jgi:hypothetical protein
MKKIRTGDINLPENVKIEIKDRFVLEALRSVGYDVYSAIYELIDNAIDAESTKIEISYNKEDETLIIKDNGTGMSFEKLKISMDIGCDRIYNSKEIGYFGVGLNSACLNLINVEEVDTHIKIITFDGDETTELTWQPTLTPLSYDIKPINNIIPKGTIIVINKVKKFSPQILKKNCGVIFYPTLKNDIVNIFVNDDEIIGNDPLYRNSNTTQTNYVTGIVNSTPVEIFCCLIDNSQEKHSWDREQAEGQWAYAKGGVYVIYGGRYVEYGGIFGVKKNFDPWDSRTRMEFKIPKELTHTFQIKFNKTNGVDFKNNEAISDVMNKINSMFSWAKKKRKEGGEIIATADEKEEMKDINKELNKSATNAGIKPLINEKDEPKDNEDDKIRKERKEELVPRKPYQARILDNEIFEIRTENLGATNCFWLLLPENNKLIITINEAHVFYREIYRNMDKSARKDMIYLLASIGIAQYETNVAKPDFNPEFFWEDFWSHVSLKLKHLISL